MTEGPENELRGRGACLVHLIATGLINMPAVIILTDNLINNRGLNLGDSNTQAVLFISLVGTVIFNALLGGLSTGKH